MITTTLHSVGRTFLSATGRGTPRPVRLAAYRQPWRTSMSAPPMRAFTLVEVLAALLLIAIVLPVIMRGITTATGMASVTKKRTEAAGLAQAKLGEIIATQQWTSGNLSGDFSPDWPDYRWEAWTQSWSGDTTGQDLTEVDVRVIYTVRNREESVQLSTLARATQ